MLSLSMFFPFILVVSLVTTFPIQKRMEGSNGDSAYVDVYGCKNNPSVNPHTEDDIANAPYGCKYDALAQYYLNIGWDAHHNLSWCVQNNDTYTQNYGAFITEFQKELEQEFLDFLQNGKPFQYYSCQGSTSDYDKCTSYGFDDTTGQEVKQPWCILGYDNLRLIPDKTDDFLTALEPYVQTSLSNDSIGVVAHHFGGDNGPDFGAASSCEFQSYSNIDMPLAVNINPNPMQFINADNVTNLSDLLTSAQNNFVNTSGPDLVDALSAVPIYWNMSVSITLLNDVGKEYKKEEKEQKEMMILSIVFGLVGVGCFFLGPIEGAVMGSILALGQMMSEYAITGKLSVGDIVFSVFACFDGIFSVVKAGGLLKNAANLFRFVKTGETYTQMSQYAEFINPRLSMFNLKVG